MDTIATKKIGVAEAKRNFSELMDEVSKEGRHFIIERNGKPVAAMVGVKDLELIEKQRRQAGGNGLLAALGAWDDFEGLDEMIKDIYRKRKKAPDRRMGDIF